MLHLLLCKLGTGLSCQFPSKVLVTCQYDTFSVLSLESTFFSFSSVSTASGSQNICKERLREMEKEVPEKIV